MRKLLILSVASLIILASSCSKKIDGAAGLFNEGIAAIEDAKFDKASAIFKSIDSLYPVSPLGKLGRAYGLDRERFDIDAISEYTAILKDNSDNPAVLKALTELALKTGRYAVGAAMAIKYSDIGGNKDTAATLQLEATIALGNYRDAESILIDGLSDKINLPRFLWAGARYYLHRGNQKDQFRLVQEAINSSNKGFEDYFAAGDYYAACGFEDSAAMSYESAARAGNKYYQKADIAEKLIQIGYMDHAKKYIRELKAQADTTHRISTLEVQMYNKMGMPWQARYAYESGSARYANYCTALMNFGRLRLATYDYTGADMYFAVTSENLQNKGAAAEAMAELMLEAAEGFIKNNMAPSATPILDKAYGIIPNDFRLLYDYASTMMYNQTDTVLELIQVLDKASVDNPVRLAQMGYLFLYADSLDRAESYFHKALKLDRISQSAALGMVSIYRKRNKIEDGINFLKNIDENLARYPEIITAVTALYENRGDHSSAVKIAADNIKYAPHDINRYRQAFELARRAGDKGKAEEICRKCLEVNSDSPESYFLYAEFYQWNKDKSMTDEYAAKALEKDAHFVPALLILAANDTLQGDFNSAIAKYNNILEIDPYNATATINIAISMLEKGDDPRAVVNQANGAVALAPENPMIYCTIGRGYFNLGKFANARISFENALKFGSENPEVNYYAGINYVKDGKPELARQHLQKALTLGLSGKLKTAAESELKKL
jgi:predicted Zn-dependent protease